MGAGGGKCTLAQSAPENEEEQHLCAHLDRRRPGSSAATFLASHSKAAASRHAAQIPLQKEHWAGAEALSLHKATATLKSFRPMGTG